VGPGNHVLDGGPDPPWKWAILRGGEASHCKYRDILRSPVRKWLNQSRCRLGCGLEWTAGNVLDGGPAVLRDVAMATIFGTQLTVTGFVGYNFGCMIASDTLFDSTGGFLGSSYLMKT